MLEACTICCLVLKFLSIEKKKICKPSRKKHVDSIEKGKGKFSLDCHADQS